MVNLTSICKVCGFPDTRIESFHGTEGCNECYSVEQGFLYVQAWEHDSNLSIDEDGMLYVESEEYDGAVACAI